MIIDKDVKVLYVDDEETNLFLFKVSFEDKYSVFTAISGMEGLEELDAHENEIIVVISDMRMPKMNGIEFIKEARKKHKNIYYFILSGYDFNDEIQDALNKKIITNFFTKPFNTSTIEEAINHAVKNQN